MSKLLKVTLFLIILYKNNESYEMVDDYGVVVGEYPAEILEYQKYRIGGLFQNKKDEMAFNLSSYLQNQKHAESHFRLVPETSLVSQFNAYDVFINTCNQLEKGVVGIFGPSSPFSSTTIQAICDRKEIPQIETHWNSRPDRSKCLINLHPHPSVLSKVYVDLVLKWDWRQAVIIYEDRESLSRVEPLLALNRPGGTHITLRQLRAQSAGNYRPMLTSIKSTGQTKFILDCSIEILEEVLKQAQQVGMMTEYYHYIITNLDLQIIDVEPFRYGGTNITGVRMINPDNFETKEYAKLIDLALIEEENESAGWKMHLGTALIMDAVQLFHESIKDLTESKRLNLRSKPLLCNNTDNWESGHTIINYMKGKTINGLTGNVRFNTEGFRTDFSLDIMELNLEGLIKVGRWDTTKGLQIRRKPTPVVFTGEEGSLTNRTFTVIICLTPPYAMLKKTTVQLTGNDQFEGYAVELIEELSKLLGFNYTIIVEPNGDNGSRDPVTGLWSGLMGAVINGTADMAIADLTVTAQRETEVDFTTQFMNLGITILYRKPAPVPPSLFMFASPFSIEVWALLGVSYLLVSLSIFVMARMSPNEWNNPYPCIEEPEYLVNQFSIKNSLWFTVGSLMQQGSELAPISVSTRTAAGVWWFFVLIMVSSYTANLAAFLTVETYVTSFSSIEELAKQDKIKYGAKRNGSTVDFFKEPNDPIRELIYNFMNTHPECMMENNDKGVEKAEKEDYAFIMESTSIEYAIERHCNLTSVGEPLDEKGYAIALKKNSPYRNELTQTILKLQEMGKLAALKVKWWKEKLGGGKCDAKPESQATPLDLKNVGGVFLVLSLGSFLGCITSFIEMMFTVSKKCKKAKISFAEAFKEEMRFFLNFKKNVKRCHSLDTLDRNNSL